MSIFDARYDRLSEIKKKRAANSSAQSGEVKAAGVSGTVKASPFDGYAVTSRPGKRNAPTAGASTNHAGLDRAMPRGTALKLPIDVTYYRSGSDKARGKWIEFKDAGGNILHYQHLDSYGIFKPGETVPAGSQIAVSGASGIGTGAHLHEEYWSPDGQNITESYWGGLSKGTASGALPTEYKKAGGNVFNAGTNALAREGKSALAGSYEGLSRFEKVQMLKKRRDERRGLRERAADKMSRADDAYTFGRKKDDYSVGGIINKWQENENAKALTYEKKNADTVNRAQQRLGDDNFKKAALDGLERAKRTVGRVYIKPSGRDDTTVLTSYMTDEELLTYSGLLQTEGQKSAAEYIDAIKDTLKARAFEHAQYPTKFAGTAKQLYNNPYDLPLGSQGAAFKKQLPLQKSGVTLEDLENESGKSYAKALAMGTAASFATAAALGKTGEQMIKNAVTGKYEPTDIYDPAFMPARLQRSAQEGTTRNDSQWMKFLKSAGFSIAGSLVNAAAGGPIGAGASLAMMGASAAGQSAFEGAERGLTPAQATTLGAVNGALEAATEMIPVKNIFKAFKSKSAARELAKEILQAGFENAEQEAINTLAGNIADEIITGDRSELMTSAREYAAKLQQEKGLSNEQAISEGLKKATIDKYITEPLYSAASGAFSGAVQTGASAASGRAAADISDTVRAYSAGQNAAAAIDKLGYKIEYTDDPGLDGKVDKGTKTVYFNREGDNIRQTVKHEISHMLENNEKYGEFRSFVKEEMPQAYKAAERRVSDRLERVNAYREERGLSKYKSDAETIEAETFAELAEVLKSDRLIRRFALGSDMPKTMRVIEFARDASARLSEKLGTDGGWSTAARKWAAALSEAQADESGVRNKIRDKFYSDYDQWAKSGYSGDRRLTVGTTSDALKQIGYKDKIITWDTEKIRKIKNKHAVDDNIIKQVPDIIENPIIIMKSLQKDSRLTLAGEVYDLNNKPMLAILETEPLSRKGEIMLNEIKIASAYGKDNLQSLINRSNILYADKNKKRTNDWLSLNGLYLPVAQTNHPYTNSVAHNGNTVNSNIRESNTNDTNTQNKIRDVEDIPAGAAKKKGYDREHFNSYADYLSNRIDRVETENKRLRQIRKTLEHMANVAGEVHVDALKISDYAAELKRQTASKMPRREIAARLEDIYTGIAKSDPTDDGTRAYNALFELADDMLSASDRVDRSMYEQYAPLREFLRSTPISLAKSDRADIADWSDFVNRNRGRIRISEKGTGVDTIYEQLAAEYPEFFAESGYTHPADRLKHIARVRDSLDPVYNNQRHTDDEAAILAQSMFANYFSDENASIEHQTLLDLIRGKLERDIADKYEEKYRKEIEHHKERVEYYKNIDKKVAERAAAAEGGEKAPEYVDTDVTDEYLHKYVKDIKFGEDAGGVRILRRKYADRESVVIDFDRPTVYRDAKPGEYTMSDDPVYKDIMERVKRRQKIEENWHEGETREGTLPYDAQNIWRNMRKFFGERDYAEMKKRVLDPLDDSKRQYEYIQRFYSNIIYEKVVKELGIKMGSRLSALTQMYGEGVLTEEDLGTISETDMEKIKKADEIFRTVYDGLLDTINDSRKAIYPHAQDKVKKIEEEIAELRQEMFLIEAGYTSGDFSELDPKKWENLKQIDIRRESAEELIYRAQAAAKERVASLDGKIEQVEAELFKIGNRADLQKYQELIDRRDRLVVRRSEIMNLTEAKVDKLKAMAQKLTNQFDENSSVYKEKLAKRLAALNRREGELIGELATDEITYGRLIQRRRDYYHHFEELAGMVPEFLGYMKVHADDKASVADRIKGYINSRGLRHNKNIDNRLAGKSADTKPKAKWQSFAQRRTQTETVNYDAVGGFKRYVAAAAYSAAIDPNISIFRALADDLAMPIDGKPSDKSMGGFIDYLRKYANELAGKSNEYGDRFIARIVGRNQWNRLNRLSSRIKSNQVVYNVSCDVAQILNVPVAIAYMRNHPAALNGAIVDTVWGVMPGKNEIKERYKYSSFLTERFSDNYTRFEALPKRTLDNIANFMLGALDEAGTKYIWNAAYRSAIAEGSKTPVRYADDVTRRMVAGRGIGELPYYQKSKLVGMLIPFTLESGNVWDAVGDMMRDSAQKHGVDTKQGLARKAAKVGAGVDFGADLLVLFVMNHLFNYILAKIRGTDGGLFDPIADIKEGVRNNKGVLKTAGLIAGDFVGSFPVGGFAAGVYPEYGIELPGGINLPSRRTIFGDSDPTRFGTNGGVILSAVKDPAHMLIPKAGGAQLRKIGKAMYAFYNGAVRTRSGKVKYELSDKSLYNIIRGLTFGTSALTETEDYYNQKEVNFHGVPDGFEYKHKSREVTIGYDKVELRGDDLEQYETLRLARYKRLAQNDNVAFTLRNPYGTPEKGWSAEKKKQYEADRDRMKTVLVGLYEQGSITKDRLREIYSAYKNGGDIRVRGVEYYAPTKVKREKKYSELTEYQRSDFKKKLDRDVKSGKLAVEDKEEYARMIRNKEWDFIATVDEYLTGDIKDLSKEEKKKVYSQINSLSTEFATRIWRERRDSWFDKWKVRRSGQLYKPTGVEKN